MSKELQTLVVLVKEKELSQISTFKTVNKVLIVMDSRIGETTDYETNNWSLFLDRIQDPGNMGAIIRVADWYGIKHISSSQECVDAYSPKVVQAAMGGHNRTNISTKSIDFLNETSSPIYGLDLEGSDINDLNEVTPGIIAVGNESKGFSSEVKAALSHKVKIPRIGGAESLNAAVACGIACHQLISFSK